VHPRARVGRRVLVGAIATMCVAMLDVGLAAAQPGQGGRVATPLRLVPLSGQPVRVNGLHWYFGTIELEAASDGLTVVDVLPLERYLLGLNEVPPDWPAEALRAQSVAARTYSLWTLAHEPAGAAAVYGFDICASVQCQVFSGADVVRARQGSRWAQAVRSTAGRAVLFGGRPILARYHSTSGGVTLKNSEVFAGSPDLPYLQPVPSGLEQGSPFFRWRVEFGLDDLRKVLTSAGWWPAAGGRLTEASTVASSEGLHYPDVVLEGRRGRRLRITAEELRAALRQHAPRLWPARYPSFTPTGVRLPETLPSNRIEVETSAGTVTIRGRGWGHGVGMSQWGARGMALQGAAYEDILTHYYQGTTVAEAPSPGRVRVGLAWARPSVAAFGAFRIVDGRGHLVARRALGTWTFASAGSGAVELRAPKEWGRPPGIALERVPVTVPAGGTVRLRFRLAAPARVRAEASGPGPVTTAVAITDSGSGRLRWRAPKRPGRYRLVLVASDGAGSAASDPRTIVVVAPPRRDRRSAPGPWADVAIGIAGAALLALLAVGARSFAGTIRK
jgi:SpoIID/LytB domain protein